ncbi:MAG: Subtilisin DY [Chloroflexi bacterium HGW-Chloroflexi-3]|nr:MAG: Subtilisin DY [Chloroflexi bacterium HGW-Chloroflexi-3]
MLVTKSDVCWKVTSDSKFFREVYDMKKMLFSLFMVVAIVLGSTTTAFAAPDKLIGVNVVLNTDLTDDILVELGTHGKVRDLIPAINALTMQVRESKLDTIRALPFVESANPDAIRNGAPVDTVAATDFSSGQSTWDLDAVNVTDYGSGRTEVFDGTGVYVAVLDTGLVDTWRMFFPEERIAEEYGIAFGGGGGEMGFVSSQPNKWEHDQNSHGTHVTSTILGYSLRGAAVNGVAPMATVIPVKVLNQNGSGWSSVVARGISYVAELKEGPLAAYPVVINMSLGGSALDAVEKAAIDHAISVGVIIVASAGNEGMAGMGFPGAYEPVISVAASGWVGEWTAAGWWRTLDVADPTDPDYFYITDFSSRELPGQDLDVAAPGSWIVGPYKINSGNTPSYYYLGGTSMASPHVAGIVALMAQKNPGLSAFEAETILETSAIPLPAGSRNVLSPYGLVTVSWGDDASGSGLATADAALAATP